MEVIQQNLDEAQQHMDKTYSHLQEALAKIHSGRAVPTMLQQVMVHYYGNPTLLHQLAVINTLDARTLVVQPWEVGAIAAIEKAIGESQLGVSTKNDGRGVLVTFPPPSEERRKNLVKIIKGEAEKAKVALRNIRRDHKESLKQLQKNGVSEHEVKRSEKKLQELTDTYVHKVDALLTAKEAELMSL